MKYLIIALSVESAYIAGLILVRIFRKRIKNLFLQLLFETLYGITDFDY
ncbi:MAG: hypothetical protein QW838_02910 [Candidatus Nitrosotenuis sp.]